ncbi:MAG: hypothetical protein PHI35_07705 [Victivallaceae bacterium]|nr:hypothetical protein [Victivallaceae bacterium]
MAVLAEGGSGDLEEAAQEQKLEAERIREIRQHTSIDPAHIYAVSILVKLLGMDARFVRARIKDGTLFAYRPGRVFRIPGWSLLKYLASTVPVPKKR